MSSSTTDLWSGARPDVTEFTHRHIGPDDAELNDMLAAVEAESLDELMRQAVPAAILDDAPLGIGRPLTEGEMLARLRAIGGRNRVMTSLIGQGYHGTVMPPVIQRNLFENPSWYTAYTPYQPEISQGRLESLLNFQTLVADLTGLDVSNASLLDEGTAAAEAMALSQRVGPKGRIAFFVDANTHPQTIAVIRTRAEPLGWTVIVGDVADAQARSSDLFGALIQYPATDGDIRDHRPHIAALKAAGVVVTVAADPLALTLLTPPGELGADIAIGSMQRFGVPMGYGGPHAGYMAVRDAYKRSIPGRLVGLSVDRTGAPATRLALQTREQHIRRERATSNICTAQALLANIAAMYACWHGPEGLTAIARRIHRLTAVLAAGLEALGFFRENRHFFDTLTVGAGHRARAIHLAARERGLNFRVLSDGRIGISLDETTTPEVVQAIWSAFGGQPAVADAPDGLPADLERTSAFLTHPVFHEHRSETEMMRYLRALAQRDLGLDRAMIPLGSCTMKLNAAAELTPVSWPEWNALHPFAPEDQAEGYAVLAEQLKDWLCRITGYDAVSLQPNSGAAGEYAGLLAIRAFHRSRGDADRNVCLIPESAHGTNPASAQMAGMEVVPVRTGDKGEIDMADLSLKIAANRDRLAAIMVTYPSTYGVFEDTIVDVCAQVHAAGGQVYLDGANLNALVGVAKPGVFGADVSHFNLHKTFCIPHGGGGPGVGPIGVKAHLAPFLPEACGGQVAAAPLGSASILPISWAYIAMMGDAGLKKATQVAILSANYIAEKLAPHYPVLFRGATGRVAHEVIIDLRPLTKVTGVTNEDVAKRLIDFGFHAPTMSWPVAGTLMIEPTESENKAELDRFINAMIQIRHEIADIEAGRIAAADSPLRLAPHTTADLLGDWDRNYDRRTGCLPDGRDPRDKYWPPVGRVDNVYGDRNLVCSCPPMEAYAQAAE
ncbi:MAG: aminomethyl-transferring glycine dehydrogenase [Sphingomonadaceae bacterium]|nr:aminomethyl-transferring glycine dehydrogenase [Sphingomonadaceae bacterium]